MADLLEQLNATRPGYVPETSYSRFANDAYTGKGGFSSERRSASDSWEVMTGESRDPEPLNVDTQSASPGMTVKQTELTYLDPYPRESKEKFKRRRDSSYYPNYVQPLTDLKISHVMAHSYTSDNRPDKVSEWRKDVDGRGTTFSEMRRLAGLRAAMHGWCPAVMSLPPKPVGDDGETIVRTQADAEALGVDKPRMSLLFPYNVLDWSADEAGQLEWTKIRTFHRDSRGPLEAPRVYTRWTIWTRTTYEVYEQEAPDDDGGEHAPSLVRSGPHSFGRVPMVPLRHSVHPDDPVVGMPMHEGVALANRALFNRWSELIESVRSNVFPILVVACKVSKDGNPKHQTTIDVGSDQGLFIDQESKQQHRYISPEASPAETALRVIELMIREIYRQARIEFSKDSAAAESGLARKYAFSQTNRALSDFANMIADWEMEIDRLACRGLGVPDEQGKRISVVAPSDFDVEDINARVENIVLALSQELGDTFAVEAKHRLSIGLLGEVDESTKAKIRSELEEIQKQEGVEGAADRAMASLSNGGRGVNPIPDPPKEDPPGGDDK